MGENGGVGSGSMRPGPHRPEVTSRGVPLDEVVFRVKSLGNTSYGCQAQTVNDSIMVYLSDMLLLATKQTGAASISDNAQFDA